jgi:hypothetical protein
VEDEAVEGPVAETVEGLGMDGSCLSELSWRIRLLANMLPVILWSSVQWQRNWLC